MRKTLRKVEALYARCDQRRWYPVADRQVRAKDGDRPDLPAVIPGERGQLWASGQGPEGMRTNDGVYDQAVGEEESLELELRCASPIYGEGGCDSDNGEIEPLDASETLTEGEGGGGHGGEGAGAARAGTMVCAGL